MASAYKTPKYNQVKHSSGIFNNVFFSIIAIILSIFSLGVILMLVWAFITSIKLENDFLFDKNVLWFPNFVKYGIKSLWENFVTVLSKFSFEVEESYYFAGHMVTHTTKATFGTMVLNSIIYSMGGAILMAFIPAIVAYILVKYKFKFSKVVYIIALVTYIIPIVGNYPSMLAVLKNTGLLDTWWGYFLMKFNFTGMYFFIYYAFFETMNDSYIEAAELDGANQFQIMTMIVFPLAKKVITTVLLIVFVQLWNDYQTPWLYLKTHPTIAYGVWYMSFHSVTGASSVPQRMASVMSMALPILLLFIFLRDKLMTNVSMGGVKE